MPYKFWSMTKPPYPCTYVPISSIPFINSIRDDWAKLNSGVNVVRAYYAYRIMHNVDLPDALAEARNKCAIANIDPHGTDLKDNGLSWQEIYSLLWG